MDYMKIVGQWRRGAVLDAGLYLWKRHGGIEIGGAVRMLAGGGNSEFEYLGPIEIVEPEPEPTPLPGCVCHVTQMRAGKWRSASAHQPDSNELVVYGDTRRQAILRHNAAVAAIVAMESK